MTYKGWYAIKTQPTNRFKNDGDEFRNFFECPFLTNRNEKSISLSDRKQLNVSDNLGRPESRTAEALW